jgi:hypothetical protein
VCGELDRPAGVVFYFVSAAGALEAAAAKLLSKDQARRIAANIAKLPEAVALNVDLLRRLLGCLSK